MEGPDSASLFAEDGSTAPAPNSVDSARVILPPTRAPFKAHFRTPRGGRHSRLGYVAGTLPLTHIPSVFWRPADLRECGLLARSAPGRTAQCMHGARRGRGRPVVIFGPSPWTDPQSSIAVEIVAARPATSENTYVPASADEPQRAAHGCHRLLPAVPAVVRSHARLCHMAPHAPSFAQRVEMPGCASLHVFVAHKLSNSKSISTSARVPSGTISCSGCPLGRATRTSTQVLNIFALTYSNGIWLAQHGAERARPIGAGGDSK